MLEVHVSDNGRGILNEEMHNLFTLFEKLKNTDDLNVEGVGMGLTICQRIVDNNQGQIDVFSEGKDKGATFIFSMKMKLPPEEDEESKQS